MWNDLLNIHLLNIRISTLCRRFLFSSCLDVVRIEVNRLSVDAPQLVIKAHFSGEPFYHERDDDFFWNMLFVRLTNMTLIYFIHKNLLSKVPKEMNEQKKTVIPSEFQLSNEWRLSQSDIVNQVILKIAQMYNENLCE